jgi:hypothetical protein
MPNEFQLSEQVLEFDWSVQPYVEAREIEVSPNCNSIMVVNTSGVGGAILAVNNFPINPALVAGANGEPFVIGGNRGEVIQRKQINVTRIGGGAAIQYFVIQKFYTNLKK